MQLTKVRVKARSGNSQLRPEGFKMKRKILSHFELKSTVHPLFRTLKPVQILTKVILFLPEWIDKPEAFQPKSVTKIILLSFSWLLATGEASLLGYGICAFVRLIEVKQELLKTLNPILWVLWNSMAFVTHVFILCNLTRLSAFFRSLKDFTARHVLLQRYKVDCNFKVVTGLYVALVVTLLISAVGLIFFMMENLDVPPLLSSISFFRSGHLFYVAIGLQLHSGIYTAVGIVTVDLGVGFVFYYLGVRFRCLALYLQDCCSKVRQDSPNHPVTQGIPSIWQTYEDIMKLLENGSSLFGPLVLINQLNHLLGTTVFTYSGIRSSFTLTMTNVVVYLANWILFYFRSIVFNTLVSRVNTEHSKLQQTLARLAATYSELDLQDSPKQAKEYSLVKNLLNRVQNHIVAVSPLGLYNITPGTLCVMGGTVTAYLVVLLQSSGSA